MNSEKVSSEQTGKDNVSMISNEKNLFTFHNSPFTFSDYETGLTYMLARYYSQGYGRFLSPDPGYDYDQLDPMSWNLYSYVRGNPIAFVDPFGLELTNAQKAKLQHLQNIGILTDWREFSKDLTNAITNLDLSDKEGANFAFAVLYSSGLNEFVDWEQVGKENYAVYQAAAQFNVKANIDKFREGIDKLNNLVGGLSALPIKPVSLVTTGVSVWLSAFSYVLSGGDNTYLKDMGIDAGTEIFSNLVELKPSVRRISVGKYGYRYYSDITKRFVKNIEGMEKIAQVKTINAVISIGLSFWANKIHKENHKGK